MEAKRNEGNLPQNEGRPAENVNLNEDLKKDQTEESHGKHHHPDHHKDYVPRHSTHGRSNNRTFGSNHEPGTIV